MCLAASTLGLFALSCSARNKRARSRRLRRLWKKGPAAEMSIYRVIARMYSNLLTVRRAGALLWAATRNLGCAKGGRAAAPTARAASAIGLAAGHPERNALRRRQENAPGALTVPTANGERRVRKRTHGAVSRAAGRSQRWVLAFSDSGAAKNGTWYTCSGSAGCGNVGQRAGIDSSSSCRGKAFSVLQPLPCARSEPLTLTHGRFSHRRTLWIVRPALALRQHWRRLRKSGVGARIADRQPLQCHAKTTLAPFHPHRATRRDP